MKRRQCSWKCGWAGGGKENICATFTQPHISCTRLCFLLFPSFPHPILTQSHSFPPSSSPLLSLSSSLPSPARASSNETVTHGNRFPGRRILEWLCCINNSGRAGECFFIFHGARWIITRKDCAAFALLFPLAAAHHQHQQQLTVTAQRRRRRRRRRTAHVQ